MLYVKNIGQYKLAFSAVSTTEVTDAAGRKSVVKVPTFTRTFGVFSKDPATGQVLHTGFTPIEDKEYQELFKTSKPFLSAITNGALIKYDEAPPEALLDSQLLDKANSEALELREKVAELKRIIGSGGGKKAADQILDLTKENEALKAELAELKAGITASASEPEAETEPDF